MTVISMSMCRATSFYLAPGKLLYFKDHVVAARIDPASAEGYDKWFLVPITHRRDVERIKELYSEWDGVIAHAPVETLKGRAFNTPINRSADGWEHQALAAAALESPQIVNVDVTSERAIEGRRPYRTGDEAGRVTYLVTRWNRELLDAGRTANAATLLESLGGPENLVADLFPPDAQGRRLGKGRTRKLTQLARDGYVAQVASAAILVSNGLINPHTEEGGKILDSFLAAQSVPLPVSVPQVLTENLRDLVERSRAAGIEVDLVKVLADAVRPERVLWPEGALLIAGSDATSPAMLAAIRALVTRDPVPAAYAPWAEQIREALNNADTKALPSSRGDQGDHDDEQGSDPSESLTRVQETFNEMVEEVAHAREGEPSLMDLPADERVGVRQSVARRMLEDGRATYLEFLAEFEGVEGLDEIGRVARILRGDMFPHPVEQALVEHMLTVDVLNETQPPRSDTRTFAELDKEETNLVGSIQRATAGMDAGTDAIWLRASLADPSTRAGTETLQDIANGDSPSGKHARELLASGGVFAVHYYAREALQALVFADVETWFAELDRVRKTKPRLCTTQDNLAKFGETRVLSATELSPAQNTQARKLQAAAVKEQPMDVYGDPVDVKVITTRAALKTNAAEMHNCTWSTYKERVFDRRTNLILRVECAAAHGSERRLFNVSVIRNDDSGWSIGEINTVGNASYGWPECSSKERQFIREVVERLLGSKVTKSEASAQGVIPVMSLSTLETSRRAVQETPTPETPAANTPDPGIVAANTPMPDAPTGFGARIRRLLLPKRSTRRG